MTHPWTPRRIGLHSLVVTMALATLSNCSGGSNGPSTGPGPTANSISINLRDIVLAGVSVVATATATMSNGQTQAVTTGWRSDAPTVATITDAGNLTPLANGEASITVAFGGAQAVKRIRVAPNYDGRWQGMQQITACTATGDLAGICEEGGSVVGLFFPIGLTLRHPGDLGVSGEFTVEELPFPTFSTQVESDGRIRFASVVTIEGIRAEVSWDVNAAEVGRLTGTIRERYSLPGLANGDVVYESNLASVARSSVTAGDSRTASARLARIQARFRARGR